MIVALKLPDCLTEGSKPSNASNLVGLANLSMLPISLKMIAPMLCLYHISHNYVLMCIVQMIAVFVRLMLFQHIVKE